MTELIDTVQLQEIGDSLVELFEITLPNGVVAYLTSGLDSGIQSLYFDDPRNEYIAIPIQVTGFEVASTGAANRPTLEMANIPILSKQIALNEDTMLDILEDAQVTKNEDLLGSTVIIRRTLLKYTQSASEAATAAVEFPSQKYVLDRVSAENQLSVAFELASPMDIEGAKLPSRVVIGKYCPWKYQGVFLSEEGGCNWPLDSGGRFYDINDDVITKDISTIDPYTNTTYAEGARVKTTSNGHTQIWKALRAVPTGKEPGKAPFYWYREDVCGKLVNSCKIRFQGNSSDDDLDLNVALPFGGFPGSKQFK